MEEKTSFIMERHADDVTVAELCRSFGISRTLGYSYICRFKQARWKGLKQLSRAPRRVWNKTSSCGERLIVRLRRKYPHYGAMTIHGLISKSLVATHVPSVATIEVILKRNGQGTAFAKAIAPGGSRPNCKRRLRKTSSLVNRQLRVGGHLIPRAGSR
jgi:hypothetical protein